MTLTVVHIVVPPDRLFMCGSEPPSVPAMLDALKQFIMVASNQVYQVEFEMRY